MKEIELVFLGRGGFGVVSSAKLLVSAAITQGFFGQAMPLFNAERRGAGFSAFLRISDKPIRRFYKILHPVDIVVCMDGSLFSDNFLKPGGFLVINSQREPNSAMYNIVYTDAHKIATELGIFSAEGNPLGNTAVLGAAIKALTCIDLATLETVVGAEFGSHNAEAVSRGYHESVFLPQDQSLPLLKKGRVVQKKRRVSQFPASSASTASNLTGEWRSKRPVFTEACTGPEGCKVCAAFCPENVISVVEGKMAIDYEYCKGCDICFQVCPLVKSKGIAIVEEEKTGKARL